MHPDNVKLGSVESMLEERIMCFKRKLIKNKPFGSYLGHSRVSFEDYFTFENVCFEHLFLDVTTQ